MASPSEQPVLEREQIEQKLIDGGIKLQRPPSSTEDLLELLDEVYSLLSKVDQGPLSSMMDALRPCMKALAGAELLRHANKAVNVSVASCISEITRILAPDSPYSDDEMKEYFQLSVMAVEKISSMSGSCYDKAVSVLRTLAEFRVCVVMLDLELDDLIIHMFKQFLDPNRSSLPHDVLSYMEKIMTLVIQENDEPSLELLRVLLSSVKRENQNVSPIAWHLGQNVLNSCADKIKPDLPEAVRLSGVAYHDYAEVVASICQVTPVRDSAETEELVPDAISLEVSPAVHDRPTSVMNDDNAIRNEDENQGSERSLTGLHHCQQDSRINFEPENSDERQEMTQELHPASIHKKRGRRPNSLRKEEEGYDHDWVFGVNTFLRSPRTKNSKRRSRNLSKNSSLDESASPSEPGNLTQSDVVSNIQESTTALTPQNASLPDEISPVLRQRGEVESLTNQDNGLNLLSVSAGNLLRAQDKSSLVTPQKEAECSLNSKAKWRRAIGDSASRSTRDVNLKHGRALGKNVSEGNGDSKGKMRLDLSKDLHSSNADGVCKDIETTKEPFVVQIDAIQQKEGRGTPGRHGTKRPADDIGCIEAPKVKNRRKSAVPKKEDHSVELVGCKIKVWWPDDEQFYEGIISAFDPETKKHKVVYIDGDEEILNLREERWEPVEYVGVVHGGDTEATEAKRQGVNASNKRFRNAKSGPAKISNKASSSKRTKRTNVKAEKGEKSLAEMSVSPETVCTSQAIDACSEAIDVHGYKVKASSAPLLRAIFAKHGDIAADCLYKSAAVRTSLLEVVCHIIKRLQCNSNEAIISELNSMESEVSDAEAAKLEVSWLKQYLKEIREVEEVGHKSLLLKDIKAKTFLVAKAAKRDLEQKQLELVEAQERFREAERCVKVLECVDKKITNDISRSEAKASSWRKLLDDLGRP